MYIKNIFKTAIFLLTAVVATSCSDDIPTIIDSITTSRYFSPTDIETDNVTTTTADLSWTSLSKAPVYQVELFAGDEDLSRANDPEADPDSMFTATSSPVTIENLAPQTVYSVRMVAMNEDGSKASKPSVMSSTFKTTKGGGKDPFAGDDGSGFTLTGDLIEFPASGFTGDITIGSTKVHAEGCSVDGNTQYFGTVAHNYKFTTRLKTGGKSSDSKYITVTTATKGRLFIYARTASSSDMTRTVVVTQNSVELLNQVLTEEVSGTFTPEGATAESKVYTAYHADVAAGVSTITFPVGAVNFYGIKFVSSEEGGEEEQKGEAGSLNFGDAAASVADGTTFTFGSASILVNNGGGKYAIDTNTQYFGDATAQTQYVTRMKSGAKSSETNGITLTLAAKGTLTIAMRSGSSSATRTFSINDAAGTAVQTFSVGDSNSTSVQIGGEAKTVFNVYTVTLDAGIYTFSYDGSVNFYGFNYEP